MTLAGLLQGLTCEELVSLPPDQRTSGGLAGLLAAKASARSDIEDHAAMLKMAKDLEWKKCPTCKILVDRIDGCNHVRCRCGTGFCYRCGKAYLTNKATALNCHGLPDCNCGLFNYQFQD